MGILGAAGDIFANMMGFGGSSGNDGSAAIEESKRSATAWQDELKKKMKESKPVEQREYSAEQAMTPNNVSWGVQKVSPGAAVGNIAGKVGTVNTPQVNEATYNVNDALGMSKSAAMGNEPSFAEALVKKNAENQIKQQMAAQGGQAFNAAANRNIANKSIEIGQAAGAEAGMIRAKEMEAARGQYADIAAKNRDQMITMSTADATNQLNALTADQQSQVNQRRQNLEASGMNAENALKAAMADQMTQSNIEMQNAQLRQQSNLANIEADLKAKGMTQDQIQFYIQQITGVEQSKMGGAQTAAQTAQAAQAADRAARTQAQSALLGAGGSVLGAMMARK